ncbi:hypothetical protein H5410_008942, partial [Solanum commersonii]
MKDREINLYNFKLCDHFWCAYALLFWFSAIVKCNSFYYFVKTNGQSFVCLTLLSAYKQIVKLNVYLLFLNRSS